MTDPSYPTPSPSLNRYWWLYGLGTGLTKLAVLTLTSALFLTRLPLAQLPWAFIGVGVVLLVVSWGSRRVADQITPQLFQTGVWIAILLWVIELRLIDNQELNQDVFLFVGWVGYFGIALLTKLVNESLVQKRFAGYPLALTTIQQGDRAGIVLGAVVGGLIIAGGDFMDLIPLAFVGAILGLAMLLALQSAPAEEREAVTSPEVDGAPLTLTQILQQPYPRSLLWLIGLAVGMSYLSFFILFDRLHLEYPDNPQRIALLVAFVLGAGQVGYWGMTKVIFPRLIARGGMWLILLLTPLMVVILLGFVAGGELIQLDGLIVLGLVVILKIWEETSQQGIHLPSLPILYQPLSPRRREPLRRLLEVVIPPVCIILAGAILVALTQLQTEPFASVVYLTLGLGLVWLWVAWQTYALYSQTLEQAVKRRTLTGEISLQSDGTTLAILKNKLKSQHVGEVIYALDLLTRMDRPSASRHLSDLLTHPAPEVRREAVIRLEKEHQTVDPRLIWILVEADDYPLVREIALRFYCRLAGVGDVVNKVIPFLDHSEPSIQRGAMVGLLNHGGQVGMEAAEKKLHALTQSPQVSEREFAAQILGDVSNERFSSYVIRLLTDVDPSVQRGAVLAAGKLNNPKYWQWIIPKLAIREVSTAAATALFLANKSIYPALESVFNQPEPNPTLMSSIARVCGRRRDNQAVDILKSQFHYPDKYVRYQVWISLNQCLYVAQTEAEIQQVQEAIREEVSEAAWIYAAQLDLIGFSAPPLQAALANELKAVQNHIFMLLSFIYDRQQMASIRYNLGMPEADKRANALSALDNLLNPTLRGWLIPLWSDLSTEQRLNRLKGDFPQPRLNRDQRLLDTITQPPSNLTIWIRATALYALPAVSHADSIPTLLPLIDSLDEMLRETVVWTLYQLDPAQFSQTVIPYIEKNKPQLANLARQLVTGDQPMLLTIEKVLILKSVGIFARVPDNILVEISALLEEVDLGAGGILFHEGDAGTAMYVIVHGALKVFTQNKVIAERRDREFIGEMSLFDDEPRSASAQALVDTTLLKLDQEAFQELMANHPEISMEIIRVLSQRLREIMHQKGISPIMADIFDRLSDKHHLEAS